MAFQAHHLSSLHSLHFCIASPSCLVRSPRPTALIRRTKSLRLRIRSSSDDDYYIDAPVSVGDGFSFGGGKYSEEPSPSDEWFEKGNIVKAHPVLGSGKKASDPIFGLKMGAGSQASDDLFRWFCIESGSPDNHSVILIHGFPSQAYSYRKVLPVLSKKYHAIAFDWLGFGFSDKPQPKYGFDYTLDEYVSSFGSLINELVTDKVSLVVQGYFSPVVVKYASSHQEKLKDLILLNPPVKFHNQENGKITDFSTGDFATALNSEVSETALMAKYLRGVDYLMNFNEADAKHANLPSALSIFSNFLLGEIFSQDPLRASDKALTSCGPYQMKEDDAMVYRRPYLTSGSSGFALNAISRSMKKELKKYVEEMRTILMDKDWKVQTTICWGERDRWLSYDGVEDFCKRSNHKLLKLPMAGHHVQEDCGEELGQVINGVLSRRVRI